jgi:hypothetical protein
MLKAEAQDRKASDYVQLLLQDRHRELQNLEVKHQQMLIHPDDYLSCRRSLLQAVAQLETLARGGMEERTRPQPLQSDLCSDFVTPEQYSARFKDLRRT